MTATAVDYALFLMLYEVLGIEYRVAAFFGLIVGGVTNFTINKYFVFEDKAHSKKQVLRYFLVWLLNLILNMCGIWFITEILELDPKLSKVIVSVIVGSLFSFVAQKKFVFN